MHEALALEKGMIVLSTAVRWRPVHRLLGTVTVGSVVMETFSGIAPARNAASLNSYGSGCGRRADPTRLHWPARRDSGHVRLQFHGHQDFGRFTQELDRLCHPLRHPDRARLRGAPAPIGEERFRMPWRGTHPQGLSRHRRSSAGGAHMRKCSKPVTNR